MRPETLSLNQTLVLSAMEAIESWEHWANIVPRGATKTLNQQLIRLSKGLIKAVRIFLIENQHNQSIESVSSQPVTLPPSVTCKETANGKVRLR
jgi:hypothetical protein